MEYEVSFNNFNYNSIIKKIKNKGKKIHGFYPFRISYFLLAGEKDFGKGFVRVRDEYPGKVTITTKILSSKYPEEYETTVDSSYDDTVKILEKSGLKNNLQSIKFREKWSFSKCHEIVFDLWPGLPLIMEIDCISENTLNRAINHLGLDINDSYTKSKYLYTYNIPKKITQNMKNLNFKNFKKLLSKNVKKNKSIFTKMNKKYYLSFLTKANQNKYKNLF